MSRPEDELNQYQFQLEQVEEALSKEPSNKELQKLRQDLSDLISLYSNLVSTPAATSSSAAHSKSAPSKANNNDKKQPKHPSAPQQPQQGQKRQHDDQRTNWQQDLEDLNGDGNGDGEYDEDDDEGSDGQDGGAAHPVRAKWIVGQTVLAKYSKDGKMYEATVEQCPPPIDASASAGGGQRPRQFYTVMFKGYSSRERVDVADVRDFDPTQVARPVSAVTGGKTNTKKRPTPKNFAVAFGNGMDRRSRKKQRNLEYQENLKNMDAEHMKKQKSWQSFAGGKKASLKTAPPLKKQSIFSTPDDPNAKVGVVGSGKPMTNFQTRGKHIYEKPL
ncbi:hypothetical protein HK101_009244 [Irineochytrium annulatum]|nr:hypothetical protein HK101_009244 [Irineochytrium annulatum]